MKLLIFIIMIGIIFLYTSTKHRENFNSQPSPYSGDSGYDFDCDLSYDSRYDLNNAQKNVRNYADNVAGITYCTQL